MIEKRRFKSEDGTDYPEWEKVRIGDVFTVTRGKVLSTSLTKQESDESYIYPVYSSQTKMNGLMGFYDEFLFSDAITWTTDGANAGEVKFRKGKFYCTNVCGVLLSDKYANTAVSIAINRVTHKYVSYVGNPKLMNGVMSEITLSLPSSTLEMKRISVLFEKIEDKINLLTKKKEALESYKKGLMQKIFSQELRFKREDGTYYPEWKKVTLGSTCKVLRGKGLPKSVISKDGLYKCIHYGELFTYYGEVIAFVNSFTDNRDGTLSQFGDVLMPSSDVTPYGLMTASMVQEDNVYLGGDINVVRPNQTIDCEVYSWDSAFLSFYLNSIPKVLMRLISGTTVKHLYTSDLKGVELWQPTKKEQELCSRLFLSINSKIEILEKELFAIHNLKKGLLQQMFV